MRLGWLAGARGSEYRVDRQHTGEGVANSHGVGRMRLKQSRAERKRAELRFWSERRPLRDLTSRSLRPVQLPSSSPSPPALPPSPLRPNHRPRPPCTALCLSMSFSARQTPALRPVRA